MLGMCDGDTTFLSCPLSMLMTGGVLRRVNFQGDVILVAIVRIIKIVLLFSFQCFRYRIFVLIIYVFLLSIIVWTTCTRLYETESIGCDCGPLTCTHASLSPGSVYPEVQCGGLAHLRNLRQSYGIIDNKNGTSKKA